MIIFIILLGSLIFFLHALNADYKILMFDVIFSAKITASIKELSYPSPKQ